MLQQLKQATNRTLTENGAVTFRTSESDCLDLFATVGALRRARDDEIVARFMRAFAEDKTLALKLLFFARDVRGGLGERRVFRVILKHLAYVAPATVRRNLPFVSEYGRFDDLLVLLDTPVEREVIALIREQFASDLQAVDGDGAVSLLGKWLPSINASNAETVKAGKRIARALGMSERAYRQALSRLRARIRILENNLRERDYTFDYGKQPSKAMLKYRQAFWRNDRERYAAFLERVGEGKATLNTATLTPYDVVKPLLDPWFSNASFMRVVTEEEAATLNATWEALPDFGGDGDALAVVDTSGSMYDGGATPAAVALSLGLYFAERNRGAYRGHFIEFSQYPELIEIKGETFEEKLRYVASFNQIANTDLEAVFDLILNTAVAQSLPAEALPKTLVIISDMEFDFCVAGAEKSNYHSAKAKFEAAGYTLPAVVFWNVASRHRQQPVTKNEQGVTLVSGCSPRLFAQVADGSVAEMTPTDMMMEVLGSERYARIAA